MSLQDYYEIEHSEHLLFIYSDMQSLLLSLSNIISGSHFQLQCIYLINCACYSLCKNSIQDYTRVHIHDIVELIMVCI